MSFVLVTPDVSETAAADLAQIGSAVSAGHLAAAVPTTEVAAAGADEVSAAIAALFGAHAQEYQAAAAQAATYYEQFVRTLSATAASYAGAETAIATSMQEELGAVTAPLLGSAAHAGSLAGLGSAVSNGFHTLVDGPFHTIRQAWINSPLGQVLDPIINASTGALIGRDLIGNGGAGGLGGTGGNQQPVVIDFVRHGQSIDNAAGLIDTWVPGTGLTPLGLQEANAIANALGQGPFAGVFASQLVRTQETAAPLANLLTMNVQILPGLDEINAGVFDGLPQISPGGLLYLIAPVAWTLGFPLVPMMASGSPNINGVVFDQGFTNALQTMYGTALTNPVMAPGGKITDVAFSSEFAIEVGTMMNVKNPDPLLMLTHPLPNTGVVVVQGDPRDGWTLESWDGVPVPPASLPTELFVDVRDLISAPQFAAYDILEALPTGDPTMIVNAIRDGVVQVGTATVDLPLAVTQDLVGAVGDSGLGGLSTDLTNLLP